MTSPHFWKPHVALVADILECVASASSPGSDPAPIGTFLEGLTGLLDTFIADKSDEQRVKQCVVAEVVAGALTSSAATAGAGWSAALSKASLDLLSKAVDECSLENCAEWVDCTRCIISSSSSTTSSSASASSAALVELVQAQVEARLAPGGATDDSSRQSKWLRLLQALIIEVVTSGGTMANSQQVQQQDSIQNHKGRCAR